ncbi:unnamed protein product [Urochloa humidicola]
MEKSHPPPSWSDIPVELAGLVLRRLPAHVDRVRFAAVCLQWRRAVREVPLPAPLPLLALPDGTVYSLPGTEPFRFPGCAGYVDACGSWLAFSGKDGSFLRNPFTNATMKFHQRFRFKAPSRHAGDDRGLRCMEMEGTVKRLTICKPLFGPQQLIATFIKIQDMAQVGVLRPGASSWWWVDNCWFPLSADMAFHQGKLYVLNDFERLFAIDVSVDHITGPRVIRRAITSFPSPVSNSTCGRVITKMLYLIESEGVLLMVRRMTRLVPAEASLEAVSRIEFEVFKADFQKLEWNKATTIGDDQVLFLQRRCSRFVRVSQEEGIMPGNRIVFLDNDDEDHDLCDEEESWDSCSVYDMRDGSVSAFAPGVSWKRGSVPATWLFPQESGLK